MYIITGGAGFIGSAVLRQLNSRGLEDIVIVDNLGHTDKWRNLVKAKYADYMHKDQFIDLVRREKLPWKAAGIVHLGACSSTTEKDADFLMENNFHYSRDLCAFALKYGIRFINASSAATYGGGENGFSDNRGNVGKLRPLNMYGYSKQLFDLWLLRENLDNKVASLKFFNVYGPNEYHKGEMQSVIVKLWREISVTGHATLFASTVKDLGDGEQKRDFVYVRDCAELVTWLLLDARQMCGIRNVGTGTARTFNDLARAVFAAMDMPAQIRYRPMPAELAGKYQNYTCADMDWLKTCGYDKNFLPLERGVQDYVRNYLCQTDKYL